MLVLTREAEQVVDFIVPANLAVPTLIRVKVLSVDGNRIRLGLMAPDAVEIDRPDAKNRFRRLRGGIGT
jgi:sRNA-binding carbon storage regulator CsrA